jgi:hypothetical protein
MDSDSLMDYQGAQGQKEGLEDQGTDPQCRGLLVPWSLSFILAMGSLAIHQDGRQGQG